ncbi:MULTISPECIES: sulfite exporter TauE/SafE family protein [unclassified Sphingomonas]|uniref:sulfite exporter TauE/SafE family protein n=1 Tax=unclassified Sphingomonas TaxID=196159 RepID=UPI0026941C56|nr:sulfite exporter TauE/SafE family protein [Sphingomonas sp.]
MAELASLALAGGAGVLGGAMNALAGGGSFATMPTLIALGLPSTQANATSNVAVQPGAIASAWTYRAGLAPIGGAPIRTLSVVTFLGGLLGSLLLVGTPARAFDVIVPWLLLAATIAIALGSRAADWVASRFRAGPRAVMTGQALLGVYGGYFGGGVGMMLTAMWGVLTGAHPAILAAPRTLMLAVANTAATIVFVASGMVAWRYCLPMLVGSILGGWLGALVGTRLPAWAIRGWTLLVTATTTAVFFWRAYG